MCKKILIKLLVLITAIISVPSLAGAVPDVAAISGPIAKGSSITITGNDFGSKTSATPLKYDFFEQVGSEYDAGDKIANGWFAGDSISPSYLNPKYNTSNTRVGSTKHVRCDWSNGGTGILGDSHCPFAYNYYPGHFSKLYATFWVRIDYDGYWYDGANDINDGNVKWFRVVKRCDAISSLYLDYAPSLVTSFTVNNDALNSTVANKSGLRDSTGDVNSGRDIYDTTVYHLLPTKTTGWDLKQPNEEVWVRVEYIMKESSAPGGTFDGTADGSVTIYYQQDGEGSIFKKVYDKTNILTNQNGETEHWGAIRFCEYNKVQIVDITFDWDDIYIDNTWARIEIGNNTTWANCTHREIQIPTAWSDTSITITANQGSFSDGDTAYLFVVDADGNVNAEGYPIKIVTGTLDRIGPISSATAPAYGNGALSITWTASDATSGVASTQLWYKKGATGTWTNTGLAAQTGTSGIFTYTPSDGDGTYYFATQSTDNAGNMEAEPTDNGDDSTVYDTVAPDPPVITTDGGSGAGDDYSTTDSSVTLNGICATDTVAIYVDDSTDGVTYTSGQTSWTYSGTLLSSKNTFCITAKDAAGNVSTTGSITVTYDSITGGYNIDYVIPAAQISQSTKGDGIITICFKIKAPTENTYCTLHTFEYSVDSGENWNAPDNDDNSESLSGGWPNNDGSNYSSSTDFDSAKEHSFTFNTQHQNISGLDGEDQSDVQVRFTVNDGAYNSLSPVTSEDFRVDNLKPLATTDVERIQ